MKIYKIAESVIAYHGSKSKFDAFSIDFVGNGYDQEGPGIYFTSSYENAKRYFEPTGQIVKVRLDLNKLLKTSGKANMKDVNKIVAKSLGLNNLSEIHNISEDNFHNTALTNYDENPAIALSKLMSVLRNTKNEVDTFQQVWIELYRNNPADFVNDMAELGYDGCVLQKNSLFDKEQVLHYVIYNKNCITILGYERDDISRDFT